MRMSNFVGCFWGLSGFKASMRNWMFMGASGVAFFDLCIQPDDFCMVECESSIENQIVDAYSGTDFVDSYHRIADCVGDKDICDDCFVQRIELYVADRYFCAKQFRQFCFSNVSDAVLHCRNRQGDVEGRIEQDKQQQCCDDNAAKCFVNMNSRFFHKQ